MSEFGLKIKNIEASTLFEYNNGIRDHYEYKDAMFTNSLFSDFLLENGLNTWKNESTRDLICLEFNFGSRSYDEEMEHLYKIAKSARLEYKIAKSYGNQVPIEKKRQKRKKIGNLIVSTKEKKDVYVKLDKEEIRRIFYNAGVNVEYISRKRNGEILKKEILHYKMLYRSTGKAKKGSCMFIRDKLYKKALNFLRMGIKLPKISAPIVELSAYAPLVSSTILDKIKINPKNILILNDVERFFYTDIISVGTNAEKECIAERINHYKLKNVLFDGQALIDESIFPKWGNGYILLRHHFCKMAAFSTGIQRFFKDHFGEKYQTATVSDMFGNIHYVKDIELITTDNAMKWLKFEVSYDYWCGKVNDNHCMFGIVKTAHPSKLGDVQKMSYQMVNSLDESIMANVLKESIEYIEKLKKDDSCFLNYLNSNKNFSNDYEVLIALCNQNPEFVRSEYFRRRKQKIIETYSFSLKSGKIIQNADNLVIVGSPYAMLLYAASGNEMDVDNDHTFFPEDNTIQCYTKRFQCGEYLAFFRSPFNSKNNLTYLHNVSCDVLEKYFNFGEQIIAVNLIGTDFQDRNNGSDQDSDAGYTTNQPDIVEHARKCYQHYPTIVNNIPKDKNVYNNTMDDFARVDSTLAGSQRDIGESSNLAQIGQTYACNFTAQKYIDYVCILSVLAQVAIDNAKRSYDINLTQEIRRIRNDIDIKLYKYPAFWSIIKSHVKKENIHYGLKCPMNCLNNLKLTEFHPNTTTLPMSHFFVKFPMEKNIRTSRKVEDLLRQFSLQVYTNIKEENDSEKYLLLRNDFEHLITAIKKQYISSNYMGLFSWLLDRAFCITPQIAKNSRTIDTTIERNKSLLIKVLYDINQQNLLKCFSKNG